LNYEFVSPAASSEVRGHRDREKEFPSPEAMKKNLKEVEK